MLPPLYEADECIDRLPIYCQNTVIYIDPIARQNFKDATLKTSNNNPHKGMAKNPGNDEHYVLNPKSVSRATSTPFEPKQIQSA